MNWTQPLCASCWNDRNPDRKAASLRTGSSEVCCNCGQETWDGIYFRIDPRTVKFPTEEKTP